MNNNFSEDVFDTVLASAFSEYADGVMDSYPSKEELDRMYPAPENGLRKIKRTVKKSRPKSKVAVCFQRVAVVFLVAVTLFAGVMAMSTDVRSAVSNAIVGWFDKFMRVSFGEEPMVTAEVINDINDFEIGYVPEGLELTSSENDKDSVKYMYTSITGEYMLITIYSPDSSTHSGDIELSDYERFSIRDREGYIFYNNKEKSGSIVYDTNGYTIVISCILDRSEIIKVAENIK